MSYTTPLAPDTSTTCTPTTPPHVRNFASSRNRTCPEPLCDVPPLPLRPDADGWLPPHPVQQQPATRLKTAGRRSRRHRRQDPARPLGSFLGSRSSSPISRRPSITRPPVRAGKTFIFDIEDGWAQLNQVRLRRTPQLVPPGSSKGFRQRYSAISSFGSSLPPNISRTACTESALSARLMQRPDLL